MAARIAVAYLLTVAFRAYRPSIGRLPTWAADAPLAAELAVVLVGVRALETQGFHRAAWLGYLLSAVAALVLAGRRRWPLAVFALTLLIAVVAIAFASPTGATSLPVVIAVYTVATLEGPRVAALLALFGAVVLALVRGFVQYKGWSDARTPVEPALVLAALFLGWAVSSHRAYVAEIEARAEQAERTREDEARRRVDAERLRIARELHDVLAHGIATINMQAGVAAHVLRDRPEHAEQALRTIKATSKDALRELRGILGLLRAADEEAEPRPPAPGMGQLDRLIASTLDAGLSTRVLVSGQRYPLPAGVDLAAYRIVQESLTNVLRHAGHARAEVTISYGDGLVTITIDDDGSAQTNGASGANRQRRGAGGYGIIGMRERAHALGGELQASPRMDGGFRVCARLPIASGSS